MASERTQRRIDSLLDEAEEAIVQLDWQVVQSRAQAVLALDPANPDGINYLAAAERALSGSVEPSPASSVSSPPSATPAARIDHPTSFAGGRYQVKQFLGEGGKKGVYLARDTTLDREVAFALIKSEGLDETSRTRIQREAQAMGRLGSHPHIVTVFDLGQEGDQPYMVTELMSGGDVEGLIDKAPDHRLPLGQAIKIAQETCRGLEFAHSRGIVHRDLKPGNVWLTESGTAKIGDFGLAVSLDRSRLTTEGMMVGTVAYMPPEQAMGGEVTPRSDLYSLGAMLYEMVTGRPPFLGDDSVAIIGQHINTPPVAPTWHNGQCPRPLDALILRLLAKDPAERPESATDVLSALNAIDLTTSVEQLAGAVDEAHALDSLAGGVFVGRHQEMGDLKAALEDALSGRGRLVMLVGEPGIGKTRTAQELATYAGLRGAQVLWGRCYEEQGVPPYWPWVQAIRSYVRERDPEQLRSEMGAGAADIAEVVSDVRERLPDLQPAPEFEPEQARFRLFDSIAAFLKTASQRQPLVLVLDDLHWADQPSLALLQFVARELGGARLLLIGTYRDMELSRQHPLAEALGELTRERLFQRVLLRGLTQDDVGRFIEVTTGAAPPRGLVEAVHTQTEGNPLFVTEVVRLLAQEGELSAEKIHETDSWTIRIPEGVREVIGRRLNRLSQRCNEALTVASIVGREFTMSQLRPLVEEVTEDRLFEILEEALAARVIEELPQSVGRYQFTHALIQETLAQELTLTRRVRLHARIAESLEEMYGNNAEAHAAELAHHFAGAESVLGTEKMVRYSFLAGERALAIYAYEEALGHFQQGLAAKEGQSMDDETAALLFGLGRSQAALSQGEARASLRSAFNHYVEAGEVPQAVAVAESLPPGSGLLGMSETTARALELVPTDSLQQGRLLCRHGLDLGRDHGDYDAALEAFSRALAIAQREEDASLEMRILANSADVNAWHLHLQESLENSLKAIELAGRGEDLYAESLARFWAASNLYRMGDPATADTHVKAGLATADRFRDRYRMRNALSQMFWSAHLRGNFADAREWSDRLLDWAPGDRVALIRRATLDFETDEVVQGAARMAQIWNLGSLNPRNPLEGMAGLAFLLATRVIDEFKEIDSIQVAAKSELSNPSFTPGAVQRARGILGTIAILQGDRKAAEEQYAALAGARGYIINNGGYVVGDRLLGLLAHTMGNLDEAGAHFDDALVFSRKADYRPELAWTCCDYADMLRERDAEGDRAKAVALLDESLAISSDLGMRLLMERVLSRREILEA